jgi:Amt family ammonium transporter
MLAGAGLLWMGWAGFNGGDPFSANIDSSIAVINTNICAATSLLMWTSLDVLVFGKPSVIGAVQGMITGLVVITPAAGKGFFAAEFHSCLKKETLCSRTNNTLEY